MKVNLNILILTIVVAFSQNGHALKKSCADVCKELDKIEFTEKKNGVTGQESTKEENIAYESTWRQAKKNFVELCGNRNYEIISQILKYHKMNSIEINSVQARAAIADFLGSLEEKANLKYRDSCDVNDTEKKMTNHN